jgi:methylmalonyl-CoA/ethylmalonyl-CoA epimerase
LVAAPSLILHHVGYAVKEIEPMTALYVERFGYEIASPVIHDPLQTALVQFLRIPGSPTYLEFVAPDGPASVLANVVAKGGGLNHLCYTCGPLEEAIEYLRATQMVPLSEPKPAVAFDGRRICWLMGRDRSPVELVERRDAEDRCEPVGAVVL